MATWHRIHRLYTPKAMIDLRQIRYEAAEPDRVDRFIDVVEHRLGHLLATHVERAKIELTNAQQAQIRLDLTDAPLDVAFTRQQLEETLQTEVERVTETVRQTLRSAGVAPDAITAVFLTGGSTAIPLARRSVLSLVPQASVVQGDAFGSVGIGLALDAQRKFG
jgi:hypothetical chaperone protein